MTEFYLYKSRNGEHVLTEKNIDGWDLLLDLMQAHNGMTFFEAKQQGFDIEGSYEDDWLYMDDGGEIRVIELTDPNA